jgi:hypothetical protein
MAKVDCSGLVAPWGTFAGGTGMYDVMRWNLDCFWIECSGSGPLGVCIETACMGEISQPMSHMLLYKRLTSPRKQGMAAVGWIRRYAVGAARECGVGVPAWQPWLD